jgi:endo-1,4-beta-xylanase
MSPFRTLPSLSLQRLRAGLLLGFAVAGGAAPLPPGAEDLLGGQSLARLETRGEANALRLERTPTDSWIVETSADLAQPWELELSARVGESLPPGTVGLVRFEARMRETTQESGEAFLWAVVQEAGPPWNKSLERYLSVGDEWQTFHLPFVVQGAPRPQMLSLGLGFRRQTLELRGLELLRFPAGTALAELPETRFSYAGREPDAPWRVQALARIEKVRQSELTLRVLDAAGRPVPNLTVRVEQVRSAFDFGSVFRLGNLLADTADGHQYRAKARELFNAGGPENDLKWPGWAGDWSPAIERDQTLEGLRWLRDHGFRTRGHVLVWPGWTHLPASLRALHETGAPPESIAAAVLAHLSEVVTVTRPYLEEWDVANELRTNRDLMDLLGEDAPAAWFAAAHALHPEARLAYNDYENHDPARHPENLAEFLRLARRLLDAGAPLHVLGLQCHLSGNPTPPTELLRAFDQCAELGLPLRITEFDLNSEDETLQGDYTRDFLIAAYSHPSVLGVQNWGFWAGSHYLPRAALYREDWSEKPNGRAWRELVTETWRTRAVGTTDTAGEYRIRGHHGDYQITLETPSGPVVHHLSLRAEDGPAQSVAVLLDPEFATTPSAGVSAVQPAPRQRGYPWMSRARWFRMHADDVAAAEAGEGRLVFWGDSITEGWEGPGAESWNTHFAPRGALNFGIGGDQTQNLLWRLRHGAAGALTPEAVILLIGTNNFGFLDEPPEAVAAGVRAVVHELRAAYPGTRVLLLGVFPRDEAPDTPHRREITALNALLAPLGALPGVTFLDFGDRFLLPDGRLDPALMPDFLHPSSEGYAIMAEEIVAWLDAQGLD